MKSTRVVKTILNFVEKSKKIMILFEKQRKTARSKMKRSFQVQ